MFARNIQRHCSHSDDTSARIAFEAARRAQPARATVTADNPVFDRRHLAAAGHVETALEARAIFRVHMDQPGLRALAAWLVVVQPGEHPEAA